MRGCRLCHSVVGLVKWTFYRLEIEKKCEMQKRMLGDDGDRQIRGRGGEWVMKVVKAGEVQVSSWSERVREVQRVEWLSRWHAARFVAIESVKFGWSMNVIVMLLGVSFLLISALALTSSPLYSRHCQSSQSPNSSWPGWDLRFQHWCCAPPFPACQRVDPDP